MALYASVYAARVKDSEGRAYTFDVYFLVSALAAGEAIRSPASALAAVDKNPERIGPALYR